MIEASSVSLALNNKKILDDISVSIAPNEFVAVMGANGAGKSSLLSLLSADQTANDGSIRLNGVEISDYKKRQLAMLRAVMPQHSTLSFPFKAWEVVAMGRTPFPQFTREKEQSIALEMLSLVDATLLSEREFPSMSGGEKQRVQLARVLNQILSSEESERYLFLDECTSSLDPAHQHTVFKLLAKLKSEKLGIIAIVHDINLAAQYCDRVVLLKEGKLFMDRSTAEVLTPNIVKEAYGLNAVSIGHPEGQWNVIAAAVNAVD
ncbi:heme ABC transporter ATP-binding protein [Marinomonas mediterranea]|uniref:heme ABC transporter ATP-binding protein n=1 Tax=Marinomonas mediterranea TaxID=119864 RepID=UPI00234AE6F2|nr:heme ABC transporter ATP-binding protein [Marinomonas mediterranea]WCN12225.1 heme ABC transporter ATP-binding protein [Marinomonas mediterranea]